ncbi:outer dense fiber protein 3-B [Chelmon rostratus]|uniref:outer dense fiber protein 3-B n=1 Tax=Chelmon rostratus TaxID=109905 RepID=UPI001BE83E05|nr:outer dense fiber protein 3-B [Chelmon rostratus]
MSNTEACVGTWRPHRPRGPIAALYGSPGPKYTLPGLTGASKHDPTKYKAPAFSFGTRHNQTNYNCSPGPQYLIPTTRHGRSGAPAFSLGSRWKEPESFTSPGPGKYSPERADKQICHSAPAFSLSGRGKDIRGCETPGPATYTLPPVLGPKTMTTPTAPSYLICGRRKTGSFLEDLQKTPGPAAYKVVDPCIYSQKPPQCSMIGRNYPPSKTTETPGPAAYYPEKVTFTRAKAPGFSFGVRHSEHILPITEHVTE